MLQGYRARVALSLLLVIAEAAGQAERPVGPVTSVITLSELIERRYRALVLFAAFTGLR